ncbi:FAD/NAD(P)-binding protein [Paracoccus spongiarum]|uniref:FAD/NAD(P)-binding protein n=1 Tax=Paracoccus spongiarum TaxID=3064387 RepID=A0ABT9J9G9_9RHOB|nr:FAD/NAD(P)-binding domain-containing protein [Paracoccus sp. 2205BS29-5]MDP5306474.1 FAD/NAD(P)-binding protein [Paracoccus sp. 2205BS29-5]
MTTAHDDAAPRLAIIGLGPRALGALESLLARAGTDALRIDLFDPGAWPGAGPNFRPDETPLCLLNIPLRLIDIGRADRDGAAFGDFRDWLGAAGRDDERFPARAELGACLAARMAALVAGAPASVQIVHHARHVRRILRDGQGWWLDAGGDPEGPYAEILLSQGQPQTAPDDQLARWQEHARGCGADLVAAYPARDLLAAAQGWAGRQVGIRGLGLSTLDALRMLTCGLGGRFEDGRYHPSGREPARILPFSLDGHPPVPKPATADLDRRFDPEAEETAAFLQAVRAAVDSRAEAALRGVADAFLGPALRILRETGGDDDARRLQDWLDSECAAPGSQETRPVAEALRAGIAEARGRVPPSTGYVVGQLCRKWQDALRQGFNPAPAAPATAAALIGFDEGLKRYSYGPPVASAEDLLALIEAGLVDPRAAADPDIRLTGTGWQLVEDDLSAGITAMVDAVLPSPDLSRLTDPLMADLVAQGRTVALHDRLGAQTLPDGRLVGADGRPQPGLCLLGRLAQGSVIAVDSIHDCFGAAAARWAEGVLGRLRP